MPYNIIFLKGERVLGTTPWQHNLGTAKQHAIDHFAIHQKQSGATEVRVVDDDTGDLVFHHPRLLRDA